MINTLIGRSDQIAKIFVTIRNSQPLDLLDFTASLTALAREHETSMRAERRGVEIDETRLLILDVRKGSIILELVPLLVPIVADIEVTNTAISFVKHIAGLLNPLSRRDGRLPDTTTQQLKNVCDTVKAIVNDQNGQLRVEARISNGETMQEIIVERKDAQIILANAELQKNEIEDKSSSKYAKVLMVLHQTSVSDLSIGKRTFDKGVVEKIDQIPRTLIYESDLAGKRIKDEILRSDGNPYNKAFLVDLDVETIGGIPKIYRILAVHEVIEIDEN